MAKRGSSYDIYGKIPIELNEPTEVGGLFSMGAAIVMFVLFYIELFNFLQYTVEGTAIAGYGTGAQQAVNLKVRIEFNVSMLSLPCEYATVDVLDVLGQNILNVTGAVKKTELGTNEVKELVTDITAPSREARVRIERYYYEEADIDIAAGHEYSLLQLDDYNFDEVQQKYPWTCIHFFHPTRTLMRTWEELAEHMKYDRIMGQALKVAVVDCETSFDLCNNLKIKEFPTIRVYHGKQHIEKDLYKMTGTTKEYLLSTLKSLINFDSGGQPEEVAKKLLLEDTAKLSKSDHGCNVIGYVRVNAVPGNFHIEARGPEGQDINHQLANLSHVVHYLRVALDEYGADDYVNPRIWKKCMMYLTLKHLSFRYPKSTASKIPWMDNRMSLKTSIIIVFTEYIVDTFYGKLAANSYQLRSMSEYIQFLDYEAPSARFSFDFSPISMRVSATRASFAKFLIGLMAILGGTYSVVGLADAICERFNPTRRQSIGRTLR